MRYIRVHAVVQCYTAARAVNFVVAQLCLPCTVCAQQSCCNSCHLLTDYCPQLTAASGAFHAVLFAQYLAINVFSLLLLLLPLPCTCSLCSRHL
jgi:hypothetical protein